jgi:hypothetical protein
VKGHPLSTFSKVVLAQLLAAQDISETLTKLGDKSSFFA